MGSAMGSMDTAEIRAFVQWWLADIVSADVRRPGGMNRQPCSRVTGSGANRGWGAAMSDTAFGLLLLVSVLLVGAAIVAVSHLLAARASREWIKKNRRQ